MDWFVFAEDFNGWPGVAFAGVIFGSLVSIVGALILGEWGVLSALAERLKRPPRDAYDEKLDATNKRIDMVISESLKEEEKLAARVFELEKRTGLRP